MAGPPTPSEVDLQHATEVKPTPAPVGPLTEKERAGIQLTWGVLKIIIAFLGVMIVFLGISEWRSADLLGRVLGVQADATGAALADTTRFHLISAERASFRAFWLSLTQMVLLNVLLPVLTALLGYVFGTTQGRAERRGE